MKQLITHFRNSAILLLLCTLMHNRVQAQLPCSLQTVIVPSAADPMTWSLYAYLAGDSICNSFNTQYTWTIYGNPNTTLTGQQASFTFSSPGYYMVCAQAMYQGITSNRCDTIVVQSGGLDCTPTFISYTQGLQASFSLAGSVPFPCYNANTIYNWSFGDSTFATTTGNSGTDHIYASSGTYYVCVSAASANGQMNTYCSQVTINANQGPFYLGGMVLANGACLNNESVMVEIYGIGNSHYQSMTINGGPDSCSFYFQTPFTTQPNQYIIRATPMTNPDYLPTYYGNTSFWGDATLISPTMSGWVYHINLIPVNSDSIPAIGMVSGNLLGNGTVVTSTLNGSQINTTFNVQACRVIILNSSGIPIGFATVNPDGFFSFDDLPEGNYSLRVDHPGIPSATMNFTISQNNSSATASFAATSTGLVVQTQTSKIWNSAQLIVFPNPTEGISYLGEEFSTIHLFDAKGRKVAEFNNAKSVDLSQLPVGIYQLNAVNSTGVLRSARIIRN